MRLLLDSHILLAAVEKKWDRLPPTHRALVARGRDNFYASIVSLWEISLKWQLGKLPLDIPPSAFPEVLGRLEIGILPLTAQQVVHPPLPPLPATKDPFDRMLLIQCHLEKLRLVTVDRALAGHPLAWRPRSA